MSTKSGNSKKDITTLHYVVANEISSNIDSAVEFLNSEGIDTDQLVHEGLKRIKKMKLLSSAKKTGREMSSVEKIKAKAAAWVDDIMDKREFSLTELIKTQGLSMSFRNLEEFSKDEIRNILIRHYTLKFLDKEKGKDDGF